MRNWSTITWMSVIAALALSAYVLISVGRAYWEGGL